MMFIMLSHAIIKLGLDKINLTFLVPGHSQNENDNAHSVIEGACRILTIYTTTQLGMLIQMAFKKNVCNTTTLTHIMNFRSKITFPQYISVLENKVFEERKQDNS